MTTLSIEQELADALAGIERLDEERKDCREAVEDWKARWRDSQNEIEHLREEMLSRDNKLRNQAEEIERLRDENEHIGVALVNSDPFKTMWEQEQEIERLRQQVTQRGARMQLLWQYLTQYTGGSAALWRDFLRNKPQAASWFDADGVPK